MRPAVGVAVEVLVLTAVLSLGTFVHAGPAFALYVVFAQLVATYFIHCPAHYLVGAALGIGNLAKGAVDSMARQPEIAGNIQTAMIIAAALIEGVTFFALIIILLQVLFGG